MKTTIESMLMRKANIKNFVLYFLFKLVKQQQPLPLPNISPQPTRKIHLSSDLFFSISLCFVRSIILQAYVSALLQSYIIKILGE